MAATSRSRTRARPAAPAGPEPVAGADSDVTGDGAPEILRLTGTAPRPGRRVVLFYIGHGKDEVTGSIPEVVPASTGLEWLHKLATTSYARSVDWAMTELLGEKAYIALRECGDLTAGQLAGITDRITGAMAQAGKDPKEPS